MTLIFGAIVGLALALTGGGGSLFAIPLLVYGLGLPMAQAVPMSLLVVGITAATGAVLALRAKTISIRPALIFAGAGALLAPVGIRISAKLPEALLLPAFAGLMVVIAFYMWQRSRRFPEQADHVRGVTSGDGAGPVCRFSVDGQLRFTAPCTFALLGAGMATGLLSGIFGVGGGFLIVPALMAVTQLSIQTAVATSLLVITLISSSGVIAGIPLLQGAHWSLVALFAGGGIVGMSGGRLLARRLSGPRLQRLFAVMILFTAAFIVVRSVFLSGV